MMTLANKITLTRAAMSIVMFLLILLPYSWSCFMAILIFIVRHLNIPIWAVFFILLRELMISTLRAIAALEGKVMAAERWGKFKTVVQMSAIGTIFFVLLVYHLAHLLNGTAQMVCVFLSVLLQKIPYTITAIAAVITWVSAISYLRNNWELLQKSWSLPICKS